MDKLQKELIVTYFRKRNLIANERPDNRSREEFDYILNHPELFDIEKIYFSYSTMIDEIIRHPESIKNYKLEMNDARLRFWIVDILKYVPQLTDFLDLNKISADDFIKALGFRPELVNKISDEKKKEIERDPTFISMIMKNPTLGYHFDLSSIDNEYQIGKLIRKLPMLAKKLNVKAIDAYNVYKLVGENTKLFKYLDINNRSEEEYIEIFKYLGSDATIIYNLLSDPETRPLIKMSLIKDYTIKDIIIANPDIVKYIDEGILKDLHSSYKEQILIKHPELVTQIDIRDMYSESIVNLIILQPNIAPKLNYDYKKIYSSDIKRLLIAQPNLFDFISNKLKDSPFNSLHLLSLDELYEIVNAQPSLKPKLEPYIKDKENKKRFFK